MNESVRLGFADKSSVSTGVHIYSSIIESIFCQVHTAPQYSGWSSCLPGLRLHILPSLDETLRIPRENTAPKLKKCVRVLNIQTEHAKAEQDCTRQHDLCKLSWFTDDKLYLVYFVRPKHLETLVWCLMARNIRFWLNYSDCPSCWVFQSEKSKQQ